MTTQEMQGIAHELKFWAGFVRTPRFLQGWVPNTPNPELQPSVREFLQARPGARVLDVGSGVVSLLRGSAAHVTACDPLGGLYECVFDYAHFGIEPPLAIPAEELAFDGDWDIVHISNALDHTQSPEAALLRLKAAVKPGGWLIVQGFEREGTFENQQGFHQWDMWLHSDAGAMEGDLCLARPGDPAGVGLGLPLIWSRHQLPSGRDWFVWMWRKPA